MLKLVVPAIGLVYFGWQVPEIGLRLAALVATPIVLLAALGWNDRRRDARVARLRAARICLHCGYDLRATPERCPECGRHVEDVTPATSSSSQV